MIGSFSSIRTRTNSIRNVCRAVFLGIVRMLKQEGI